MNSAVVLHERSGRQDKLGDIVVFTSASGDFGALWVRVEVLKAVILEVSIYPSRREMGVTYREYAVLRLFRVSHRPASSQLATAFAGYSARREQAQTRHQHRPSMC